MELRGKDFRKVFDQTPPASVTGAEATSDRGWFPRVLEMALGSMLRGSGEVGYSGLMLTRVTKTMTAGRVARTSVEPRAMRFSRAHDLIRSLWKGGINEEGQDDAGACEAFTQEGFWDEYNDRNEPFVISFAPVRATMEERFEEVRHFRLVLNSCLALEIITAPVALEIDLTRYPSDSMDWGVCGEVKEMQELCGSLGRPIGIKMSDGIGHSTAFELARHFDFMTVVGAPPSSSAKTPIIGFVAELRRSGLRTPIIVSGVRNVADTLAMVVAGADAVCIDASSLRSREIRAIIRAAERFPDR